MEIRFVRFVKPLVFTQYDSWESKSSTFSPYKTNFNDILTIILIYYKFILAFTYLFLSSPSNRTAMCFSASGIIRGFPILRIFT